MTTANNISPIARTAATRIIRLRPKVISLCMVWTGISKLCRRTWTGGISSIVGRDDELVLQMWKINCPELEKALQRKCIRNR